MAFTEIEQIGQIAQTHQPKIQNLFGEVKKVLVGQDDMLLKLLVALLCRSHVLLEGVPGLAKTLTINTLARSTGCLFNRIQFTPDLLPADIIGTRIYNPSTNEFLIKKGPIFANLLLADEINRAPAKVQSALLEAMQEKQVTIGDETFLITEPFMVMATQNPIETEGTYQLPEAQLDRFMLKVKIGYPSKKDELTIIDRNTTGVAQFVDTVLHPDEILKMQQDCDKVHIEENIKKYILELVFATRSPGEYGLDLGYLIEYGASPRASIFLAMGAKAIAFVHGRGYVTPDDVKRIAMDVLRHRVLLTYEADAEDMTSEKVISRILNTIHVP